MMRTDAGFHADQARRRVGKAGLDLATRPFLTQHNCAMLIVFGPARRNHRSLMGACERVSVSVRRPKLGTAPNRFSCARARTTAGCRPPMAANLTGKSRLQAGQAHVISPAAGVDHDGVRALVVGATDDEPGRTGLPHFSDGDLLLALHFDRWRLQLREAKQRQRAGALAALDAARRAGKLETGASCAAAGA